MALHLVSSCFLALLSGLLLSEIRGEETRDLEKQFQALQERHRAQDEAVSASMAQLYVARLRSMKQQAAREGHYETAQLYQRELKNTTSTPLTLTFYPEEAELTGGVRSTMRAGTRVLTNWTSKAKATWSGITLPQGGYEAVIVYSGNSALPVSATLHEAKYHLTAALPASSKERRSESLGNLRLAKDTSTLSLTLGDSAASSSIHIHEVILIAHAP